MFSEYITRGDDELIPKIIHYCWFSGEPFDRTTEYCIKSWKEKCPDYEIRECNATNLDMTSNQFMYEAYKAKKWAFAADYARLLLLYKYGGIYMDGDVEVLKSFDDLINQKAFIGQERSGWISAGVIASEPGNPVIKTFLDYYKDKHFVNSDGTYNQVTNVQIITHNLFETYGFLLEPKIMMMGESLTVYPVEYFSPKDGVTGVITTTSNTHTIHHFNNAWKDVELSKANDVLIKILGPANAGFIKESCEEIRKNGLKALKRRYKIARLKYVKRKIIKLKKKVEKDMYI